MVSARSVRAVKQIQKAIKRQRSWGPSDDRDLIAVMLSIYCQTYAPTPEIRREAEFDILRVSRETTELFKRLVVEGKLADWLRGKRVPSRD